MTPSATWLKRSPKRLIVWATQIGREPGVEGKANVGVASNARATSERAREAGAHSAAEHDRALQADARIRGGIGARAQADAQAFPAGASPSPWWRR